MHYLLRWPSSIIENSWLQGTITNWAEYASPTPPLRPRCPKEPNISRSLEAALQRFKDTDHPNTSLLQDENLILFLDPCLARSPKLSYLNHLLQDRLRFDSGTLREQNPDFEGYPGWKRMKKVCLLPHSRLPTSINALREPLVSSQLNTGSRCTCSQRAKTSLSLSLSGLFQTVSDSCPLFNDYLVHSKIQPTCSHQTKPLRKLIGSIPFKIQVLFSL